MPKPKNPNNNHVYGLLLEATGNRNVGLPDEADFTLEGSTLTIALEDRAIGLKPWSAGKNPNWNMQVDPAAFEAWALILKARLPEVERVRLERRKPVKTELRAVEIVHEEKVWNSEHYMRFLYRVMKFEEAYGEGGQNWFSVGDDLQARVDSFRNDIYNSGELHGNEPGSEPKGKSALESLAEKWFRNNPGVFNELLKADTLFNQLPTGVFKGENNKNRADNRVFTGGGSAIDLWAKSKDNKLLIFELKTGNVMAGIITELMFYCNLMRDTYVNGVIEPAEGSSNARGFGELRDFHPDGIVGCMLTDELHPLINGDVLRAMSESGIQYRAVHYNFEFLIKEGSVKMEAFDRD